MKDTYSKIKDNYNCPFNLIDDLIGGKWKLRIVAHIINGDNRFSILQKKIDDTKGIDVTVKGVRGKRTY